MMAKATYITNLDNFAARRTIGYTPSGTIKDAGGNYSAMCCAYYPYLSRGSRGAHGCTTQYNGYAASSDLKGTISNLGGYDGLIPGMEIYQGDATTKDHMGVYFGKYDFGYGLEHAVYQSSTNRGSLRAKYEDSLKEGPNLTQMNTNWKYWCWPMFVVQ